MSGITEDSLKPLTVKDLTEEHFGFYMEIQLEPNPDDFFQKFHRSIDLGGIRRWEYPEGTPRTGLLDVSSKAPGVAGAEYHDFSEDAKVTLIRQVRKPRKSRKKVQS